MLPAEERKFSERGMAVRVQEGKVSEKRGR
jgi:hypothetical protein